MSALCSCCCHSPGRVLGTSADFSCVKFVDGLYLGDLGKRSSCSSVDQTLSGEESICSEGAKKGEAWIVGRGIGLVNLLDSKCEK